MAPEILAENVHLAGARNADNKEDCMKLYDEWAATYNSDLALKSQEYVAPILTAQAALQAGKDANTPILDAGCGTGLVAEALAKGGAKVIDGMDLSPPMLKIAAETGAYRNVEVADLTQPINKPDAMYGIITCAGTFTRGHVGPVPAMREFVRITQKNGIIVATILDEIWVSGGYKAELEKLESEGLVKVVSKDVKDYRKGPGDKATLLVLEKTA